jgi:hypothetical protein
MDGYIVGSMISANSITGEQIQANSIKTANLELSAQQKIQNATDEETVKALIKADLDGFESTLSKEFVTVENATTQIQQATEVAVKEATQSIIDNAVTESMGAVDGQLNDKLNQYTGNTLLPAIAEKAEEVLQNAEDYVVTKLESYATKQELSSSISQTREQIELSVSEKYTTKTESATIITEAIDGITVGAINRALGTGENKSFKFNGGANETWLPYKFSNDISDKEAYVSFNYTLTGTAQNGSQIEFAPSYLKKTNNQTVYRPKHIFFTSNRLQDINITDTVSFTTKNFQDISPSSTSYIRFVGNGFTGTLSISEVQIKPGNSKTSWSPAPEDVNNDIVNAKNEAIISANNTLISTIANHYTKSETDSKISVAKDEINLGVSNTYETKTNVETKVASTLNSAKSYADTKKNEAISSANNTLNSTIANYYTKEQTNSQINVAKEAINLDVSKTYETKTNVTNKINGVNNSINILTTRMTNAESKITDEAITNTVKQNFYTKQETENAITTKGYATTAQVQQTAENVQFKFSQSGGYNLIRNGYPKPYHTEQWWIENTSGSNGWWFQDYGELGLANSGYNECYAWTSVFKVYPYKKHSFSCYVRREHNVKAVDIYFVGCRTDDGAYDYIKHLYSESSTTNGWVKVEQTFEVPGDINYGRIRIDNKGAINDGVDYFVVFFNEVMLCLGENNYPQWSPNPAEIYDGITTIDKDGINVATSYGAHTQFHAGGMSSYNNSNQRTLGIENGGISFHSWNNNALGAYITQSSLWGGSQSSNGLAISTTANGTYLALGTSSLSDVNTTLNMDQALTISASDGFQPRGINFWKDVHAHGYGIRQLSHLQLAGSGAIQFDYLHNSPSTIYEAVDNGHSLYVMGGYQMHLGVMEGSGSPHAVIWMRGKTDTHSYTHWDFHNYTMYNMKTASTYANYNTRRIGESYGVTSNVDGVRYVYRDVELVNGRAIRSIPLEYKGCEYDIVSIVCKGRGNAWVQDEDVDKFVIEGDCQSVNIEIIIREIEQNLHTVALDEAYVEPLSQKIEPEIPTVITNVPPDTL